MALKRLDTLEIATAELDQTIKLYRDNFGFSLSRPQGAANARLKIGDAEIELKSGPAAAAAIAASGEGMMGLWLEADDVDEVAKILHKAGYSMNPIRREGGRRVLEIDPKVANQVPLFIFDRKP